MGTCVFSLSFCLLLFLLPFPPSPSLPPFLLLPSSRSLPLPLTLSFPLPPFLTLLVPFSQIKFKAVPILIALFIKSLWQECVLSLFPPSPFPYPSLNSHHIWQRLLHRPFFTNQSSWVLLSSYRWPLPLNPVPQRLVSSGRCPLRSEKVEERDGRFGKWNRFW